ncbi:MAG: DUF5691 domain-containing protein [Aureispira sp.]
MPINAWEALVRQALVGNNVRNKDAFALLEQLQEYGFTIDAKLPPEQRLLQAAALQQYLHAAAHLPSKPNIAAQSAAPTEENAYCNRQRISQLRLIMRYKHDEILLEWLTSIAAANEVLLPELLPELLDYCAKRDFLQPYLFPVLGNRGQWLAQLNPNWHYAQQVGNQKQDIFFYGERAERLKYLQQLAQAQPLAALELVQKVWPEEGHSLRAAFLTIFIALPPLHKALPFWEEAALDSRQTVRQHAITLLKQFPQASLVLRMQEHLQQYITFPTAHNTPEIVLPKEVTTALRKDGIVEQKNWLTKQGKGANILTQMIAMVPPQWWTEQFPWKRAQWIDWAQNSDWAQVFFIGWARAAQQFQAIDWLMDCQQWFLAQALKPEINTSSFEFLYDNLPNVLFQQLAAHAIALEGIRPFTDHHPLFTLLLVEEQSWSEDFSKRVIQRIQLTIERESYVFHWTLKAVLKRAAYAIPAHLHQWVKKGWPEQSAAWPSWQKEVNQLLSLLQFREEILQNNSVV